MSKSKFKGFIVGDVVKLRASNVNPTKYVVSSIGPAPCEIHIREVAESGAVYSPQRSDTSLLEVIKRLDGEPVEFDSKGESIIIRQIRDDLFVIETTLANGWTQSQTATNEQGARCYAQGMLDGINIVKNMIGIGPRLYTHVQSYRVERPVTGNNEASPHGPD